MAEQQLRLNIDLDTLTTKLGETIELTTKADIKTKQWGENAATTLSKAVDSTGDFQKSMSQVRKEVELAEKNTSSYEDELKQLREVYENLVKSQKEYTKSGKDLKPLAKQMKVVRDRIKDIEQQQDKLNNKSLTAFEKAKKFASNISNIFKGFVALQIVGKVVEFGQALKENIELTSKQRKELAALTNLQGQALDGATSRAKALSETFGLDFDSILLSVNAQATQLGISFDESLSLAEQALGRGKVDAEEYLEVIKEYPTFLNRAGVEAGQLNEILELGFASSNIGDRAFATLEEGTQRLGEFTKSTEDALLQAFGTDFTKELKENIDSGKITILEAMQQISEEIATTDLTQQQQSTLLTDVFGGAGEGALEFVKSIRTLDGELDELNETQKKYAERQRAVNEANKQLAESQLELANLFEDSASDFNTFVLQVQAVGLKAFVEIAKNVKSNLLPVIERLQAAWVKIGERLGLVSEDSTLLNTVFEGTVKVGKALVTLFSLLVDGLTLTTNGFIWLYDNVAPIRWIFDNTASSVDSFATTIINLPKQIRGGFEVAKALFQGFGDAVSETIDIAKNKVVNFLTFGFVGEAESRSITDVWSNLGNNAANAYNASFIEELSKDDLKAQLEQKLKDLQADRQNLKLLGASKETLVEVDKSIRETQLSIEKVNQEIEAANKKTIEPSRATGDKTPTGANTNDLKASKGIDLAAAEEQRKLRERQIKEAEKHKQELIKIEQSLNGELLKIQKDIENNEIQNLDDGEEKFSRIKAANEKEISELEANLKAQQELLLEEGQITTERALGLEQQRNTLIKALRDENYREYLEQFKEFNESENETLKGKLAEKQRKELEYIDKENELQKSRVKAASDYLNAEGEVTAEGRAKLLELDLDYLESKILFYEQLDKFEKDALGLNESEIETLTNNLKAQIAAVKGEISNLSNEGTESKDFDLLELFGIDGDKEKAAVKQVASIFGDLIGSAIDSQIAEQEKLLTAIDKEIEAKRNKLEEHKELEEEGLAFDLENEQARIDELEAQREKAVKAQERAVKKKAAIEVAEQTGSLVTSAANLFKSTSNLPLGLGVVAAIGLIAQMYSIFNNFKKQVSSDIPKFRLGTASVEGGVEGQDSVLAYLMPREAVLPVDVATKYNVLVQGLLEDDKKKVAAGVGLLEENYNISPILDYQYNLPTFSIPDFSQTVVTHQNVKQQIEEERTVKLAAEIVKEQSAYLERIAGNTGELVKQGEKQTYVLGEKGTIVEKSKNLINKIKVGPDKTRQEELLEEMVELLKRLG